MLGKGRTPMRREMLGNSPQAPKHTLARVSAHSTRTLPVDGRQLSGLGQRGLCGQVFVNLQAHKPPAEGDLPRPPTWRSLCGPILGLYNQQPIRCGPRTLNGAAGVPGRQGLNQQLVPRPWHPRAGSRMGLAAQGS